MATGTENNPLGGTNPHGHFIQPATMGRGIARSASKCASAIQRMAHRRKWNLIMKGDLDSSNSVNSSTSQGCLPGPYCLKSCQAIPCNCHALITPKMEQCSMPWPGAEHAATCCPHAVAIHCLLEKRRNPCQTPCNVIFGKSLSRVDMVAGRRAFLEEKQSSSSRSMSKETWFACRMRDHGSVLVPPV
jgi:hypothetical protein